MYRIATEINSWSGKHKTVIEYACYNWESTPIMSVANRREVITAKFENGYTKLYRDDEQQPFKLIETNGPSGEVLYSMAMYAVSGEWNI